MNALINLFVVFVEKFSSSISTFTVFFVFVLVAIFVVVRSIEKQGAKRTKEIIFNNNSLLLYWMKQESSEINRSTIYSLKNGCLSFDEAFYLIKLIHKKWPEMIFSYSFEIFFHAKDPNAYGDTFLKENLTFEELKKEISIFDPKHYEILNFQSLSVEISSPIPGPVDFPNHIKTSHQELEESHVITVL